VLPSSQLRHYQLKWAVELSMGFWYTGTVEIGARPALKKGPSWVADADNRTR
jgi:hypothetical protein